jgi:DNA-binding response OmpR family regulator
MWFVIPDKKGFVDFSDVFWLKTPLQKGGTMSSQAKKHESPATPQLHLLLIDDDPMFLKMIKRAADRERIAVTECSSIGEVEAVALSGVFDAAVVDYYLDAMKPDLKGTALAGLLGKTPTILVSQHEGCMFESDPWPQNVQYYLNKNKGPEEILRAAVRMRRDAKRARL